MSCQGSVQEYIICMMEMSEAIVLMNKPPISIIEQTVEELHPGLGSVKTGAIAAYVAEYINTLLNEVEKDFPEFRVSEVLNVGSYSEGTKIVAPSEFDYLAVIEELSEKDCVSVAKAEPTEERPCIDGLVKVKVADHASEKWRKYLHEGYLRCFQMSDEGIVGNLHETFGTAVVKTIAKLARNEELQYIIEQNLYLSILSDCQQYKLSVLETKEIKLRRAEVRHPNVLLVFVTEGCRITADLCPAMRYPNVPECFDEKLCASRCLAEMVLHNKSILLVGQLNCDFRITFTEAEVEYMRTKLHKNHKILYMYLKYIFHFLNDGTIDGISSYMLKMLIIHHDISCSVQRKTLTECYKTVCQLLDEFIRKEHLPSVFNTNINLLNTRALKESKTMRIYRRHALAALEDIADLQDKQEDVGQHMRGVQKVVKKAMRNIRESVDKEVFLVQADECQKKKATKKSKCTDYPC